MAKKITKGGDSEFQEFVVHSLTKIDQRLDQIDLELKNKADKAGLNQVVSGLSGLTNRIILLGDKIDEDRAAQYKLKSQVGKHGKWHRQTAEKAGIKMAD